MKAGENSNVAWDGKSVTVSGQLASVIPGITTGRDHIGQVRAPIVAILGTLRFGGEEMGAGLLRVDARVQPRFGERALPPAAAGDGLAQDRSRSSAFDSEPVSLISAESSTRSACVTVGPLVSRKQ